MALSDSMGMLASPLTIIECSDEPHDIEAIVSLVNQWQVALIVVGLPRTMNGSIGKQAEKVNLFVQGLCNHVKVPVELRDERLTTVSAKRLLQAANTKKTRRKTKDDAVAAALILQGYLDETYREIGVDST